MNEKAIKGNIEEGFVDKLNKANTTPLKVFLRIIFPDFALKGAFEFGNTIARLFAKPDSILRKANSRFGQVKSLSDIQQLDLKEMEILAGEVTYNARLLSSLKGSAVGLFSFVGLALDIPLTILNSIYTIRKIGFCYGIDTSIFEEEEFIAKIFEETGFDHIRKKIAANVFLQILIVTGSRSIWAEIESNEEPNFSQRVLKQIRKAFEHFGFVFTKRKMFLSQPILGAISGCAIDVSYASAICNQAKVHYRERAKKAGSIQPKLPQQN